MIRDARWYQRQAAELARAGRYPQAMQTLFLARVLRLDEQKIVRFHPSKTPGDYAREARLPAPERLAFSGLVGSLYRYAFAGDPCTPDDFRSWQQGLGREWHATEN